MRAMACELIRLLSLLYFPLISSSFNPFVPRLGVDYSRSNIGLAISSLQKPKPLRTIKNTGNMQLMVDSVIKLAELYGVKQIVVGVPVGADGVIRMPSKEVPMKWCIDFSTEISKELNKRLCNTEVCFFP